MNNLKLGTQVQAQGADRTYYGTLEYLGAVEFAKGEWAEGTGKNDGSVQDVSYFKCAPNTGVFVLASKVQPLDDAKKPGRSPTPTKKAPLSKKIVLAKPKAVDGEKKTSKATETTKSEKAKSLDKEAQEKIKELESQLTETKNQSVSQFEASESLIKKLQQDLAESQKTSKETDEKLKMSIEKIENLIEATAGQERLGEQLAAAEAKLEQANKDLFTANLRYQDALANIERYQSKDLQQSQTLVDLVAELQQAKNEIDALNIQIAELQNIIKEKDYEIEQAKTENEKLSSDLDLVKSELSSVNNKVVDGNNENKLLENKITELENENQKLSENASALIIKLSKYEEESHTLKERLDEPSQVQILMEKNLAVVNELAEFKTLVHDKEEEILALSKRLAAGLEAHDQIYNEHQGCSIQIETLHQQVNDLKEAVETVTAKLAVSNELLQTEMTKKVEGTEVETLKEQLQVLSHELEENRDVISSLKESLADTLAKSDQQADLIFSLQSSTEVADLKELVESLKSDLDQAQITILEKDELIQTIEFQKNEEIKAILESQKELNNDLDDTLKGFNSQEEQINSLKSIMEEQRVTVELLQKELERNNAKEVLEKAPPAEVAELQEKLLQVLSKLNDTKNQLDDARAEIVNLQTANESVIIDEAFLEAVNELEQDFNQKQDELVALKTKILSTIELLKSLVDENGGQACDELTKLVHTQGDVINSVFEKVEHMSVLMTEKFNDLESYYKNSTTVDQSNNISTDEFVSAAELDESSDILQESRSRINIAKEIAREAPTPVLAESSIESRQRLTLVASENKIVDDTLVNTDVAADTLAESLTTQALEVAVADLETLKSDSVEKTKVEITAVTEEINQADIVNEKSNDEVESVITRDIVVEETVTVEENKEVSGKADEIEEASPVSQAVEESVSEAVEESQSVQVEAIATEVENQVKETTEVVAITNTIEDSISADAAKENTTIEVEKTNEKVELQTTETFEVQLAGDIEAVIVEEAQTTEVVEETQATEVVEEAQVVTEVVEVQATEVVEVQATEVVEETQVTEVMEEVQATEVVEETQVVTEVVEETQATEVVEETQVAEVVEETQVVTEVVEETQVVTEVVEDAQVTEVVEEAQVTEVVEETQATEVVEVQATEVVEETQATEV
ncbi:CAP-Gly domain-containing linker protein 4, partial [Boothiomyces macroporosus]